MAKTTNPLIEYIPIPADFGKQQERKVSFCRSTERLWRKHDKMCEEDRIEPSARAQGEMLEEMKALNSDPEIKQFHLSDARLKALTLHRKIHRSNFRKLHIQDHQDTFFTGIQERRKIPYKSGKPSDDTLSSALRIGESRAQVSTTPGLKTRGLTCSFESFSNAGKSRGSFRSGISETLHS